MKEPRNYSIIKTLYKIYGIISSIVIITIIVLNMTFWSNNIPFYFLAINFIFSLFVFIVHYQYFLLQNKDVRWGINILYTLSIIGFLFISQIFDELIFKIFVIIIVLSILWLIQLINSKEVLLWIEYNNVNKKKYNIHFIVFTLTSSLVTNIIAKYFFSLSSLK